jgi:hypothetical protein
LKPYHRNIGFKRHRFPVTEEKRIISMKEGLIRRDAGVEKLKSSAEQLKELSESTLCNSLISKSLEMSAS